MEEFVKKSGESNRESVEGGKHDQEAAFLTICSQNIALLLHNLMNYLLGKYFSKT